MDSAATSSPARDGRDGSGCTAGPSDATATIEIADWSKLPARPLVSVYMLAYRHEKFIAQAIEGVIAQQCDFPIELIIGEDCSPDRTREIVLDYQRRYPHLIRVLTSERNIGALANARRCLEATRAEFVAICEGDDYWHHARKLAMQVARMEADPSLNLCHTDFDRLVGRKLRRCCHRPRYTALCDGTRAYRTFMYRWSVMTATAMYRKNTVEEFRASRFRRTDWPFGDYNLSLYAAATGGVAFIPQSTAVWRKVAGSATNASPEAILRMREASLACREMFMQAYPVDHETRQRCLCFANRNVMNAALHACDAEAFTEARNRLVQLGCRLPRVDDCLRRAAMRLRFPARWYQRLRAAYLRVSAERL